MPDTSSTTQNSQIKPSPIRFYRVSNRRAAIISALFAATIMAAYIIFFTKLVSFSAIGILLPSLALLTTAFASALLGFYLNKFIFGPHQPYIQEYIKEEHLPSRAAKTLKPKMKEILISTAVREVYLAERLTFSELLWLTQTQHKALEFPEIRKRFIDGKIDLSLIETEIPLIKTYIKEKHLSMEDAKNLNLTEKENLASAALREVLQAKSLTFAQLRDLKQSQRQALEIPKIRKRFIDGKLDFAFIEYPLIQTYVNEEHISLAEAQSLNFIEKGNLNSPELRQLFQSKHLKIEQIIYIGFSQSHALKWDKEARQRFISGELDLALVGCPLLEAYVKEGHLTLQQVKNLPYHEWLILISKFFRQLFIEKHLTFAQLINLGHEQEWALEHNEETLKRFKAGELELVFIGLPVIKKHVDSGYLTLESAQTLTHYEKYNLNSEVLAPLVEEGLLDIQRLRTLSREELRAIENRMLVHRILNGELTVLQVLGGQLQNNNNINKAQSTHTESVHKTVSKSALRLLERYNNAADTNLEATIKNIQLWATNLKDDTPENRAAKSCMPRITHTSYKFSDPTSKVSIRQLLALAWAAMHDNDKRIGTQEDALNLFATGLYEIQRGYNFNDKGTDLIPTDPDRNICRPGTFNKIMEKLVGIHPDVIIVFTNKKTAALKLPIIVKEEAKRYLTKLINDKQKTEPATLDDRLEHVKKDGVATIWDNIKSQVNKRFFDEFGGLFKGKNDTGFTSFVAAGEDTEISEITLPPPYSLDGNSTKLLLISPGATQHTASKSGTENSQTASSSATKIVKQVAVNSATLQTKTPQPN